MHQHSLKLACTQRSLKKINIDINKETHFHAVPAVDVFGDITFFCTLQQIKHRSSHCVPAILENIDMLFENLMSTKSTPVSVSLLLYISAFECICCCY